MIATANSFCRTLNPTAMLAAALACALILTTPLRADFLTNFGSGPNQFTMTFVPIGNPGNAADTAGNPSPAGSVGYHYNMGKHEVSRDMINKANAAGGLEINAPPLNSDFELRIHQPAFSVSWNEAARFVNWLNTSQGYSAAYKFATQPGQAGYNPNENIQLWLPDDLGYNASNQFRNSKAHYFLPSMDEWYKAAYYDPNKNNGAGGYWTFPTGSDSAPTQVSSGIETDTAVYNQNVFQGPADITNAGGLSKYGVMGMGGNAWEWEETEFDLQNDNPSSVRGLRGGSWGGGPTNLLASNRTFGYYGPSDKSSYDVGFRVASVPEPSSAALLMIVSIAGLWQRRRRVS
jgi:formylglycine-generating enzyme required for sulfatase activity